VSVAAWAQRHARTILFLLVVLAAGGGFGATKLPVSLFPHLVFPRIRVDLDAGDRPAERMLVEVTIPSEESLRAIPGVRGLRSTTSRGSAEIFVAFDWGWDMTSARLQVSAQISKILPDLPSGTGFDVELMDPTVFPVIAYSLTSDRHSLIELRNLALYQLLPVLSRVNGVAHVDVQGGAVEEVRVVADEGKLLAFGLTMSDLSDALAAQNVVEAVGQLEDHDKLYLVVSDTQFKDIEGIRDTVVSSGPGQVVRLRDVAAVRQDTQPRYTRVTADGHEAVILQVTQQPGGNTVQISEDVREALQRLGHELPILKDGTMHMANWYDQSQLILESEHSARDAIVIGIGLAVLVLFAFLRNWRITMIALVSVPAVLAVTILLLYVFGLGFNIMTLGGMAAAVGLIIDDTIVIVEHIARRLRDRGREIADGQAEVSTPRERIEAAVHEFTKPLAGSSLSTIVIFLPLAFLSGVTGSFFKALSLTMASSLVLSFFVAWLAVPVLAAHWLGRRDTEWEEIGWFSQLLQRGYAWILHRLLAQAWLVLLLVVLLFGAGYVALQRVPSGFLPAMDEGGFILDYVAEPGTSLTETDRMLRQVEAILQDTPSVETYSRRTGMQLGGALTETNTGDFFVRLKRFPRPPIEEVMDSVRERVEQEIPGLEIETAQLMEDLIGDLTSVPQPIEVKIYSDDESTLEGLAPRVADAISKVAGVAEVKTGIVPAGDALDIEVDRVKAALSGMAPEAVTRRLEEMLRGVVPTQVLKGPRLIGVRVWTPAGQRRTVGDLSRLLLRSASGLLVPVAQVATICPVIGQPEINRENLKRMIAITGRITGRDLGSTVADVKRVLDKPGLLPAGIGYELGGLYQQQQIAFAGQLQVIVAALLLVFGLLLYLYESFRVCLAMLLTTLSALACVILGLWATGTELNISSIMGATMIVGIVTEVGIFLFSEYLGVTQGASRIHRLIAAGANRARAITMTTVAAMLALLPLALGIGQGAAMLQPLAIAIIAGLLVQVPLVLFVLPMFLELLGA